MQLDFKECFHEHESTKTIRQYYTAMDYTYKYVKLFVYHFFVFVFGFILAIVFAIINGIVSFVHVWIYGPSLKVVLLWVYAVAPLATVPLRAIITPMVDVLARTFRQIRVQANLSGPLPAYLSRQSSSV